MNPRNQPPWFYVVVAVVALGVLVLGLAFYAQSQVVK
jgi:hypothetical protein